MKIRLFFIMALLYLMSEQAFALNFMGPPTAELNQGQWAVGYNYAYSVQDLNKTGQDWSIIIDDIVTSTGEGQLRIEDLTVQRHYIGVNCGLIDSWEIYARIGFSDVEGDINWLGEGIKTGYDFSNDFAWGWGTKITLKRSDTVAWGASLHMDWLDTSTSKTKNIPGSGLRKDTVSIDTYDTLLAVWPTIDMSGWKLYGGLFYYSLDGDYCFERNSFELDTIEREDANIKEGSDLGAFIGAVLDVADNSDLTAELSFTSDGWALGAGIAQKF